MAGRPGHTPRILVAEDNPLNQKVLLALLERLGHTAVVVVNGGEAVDAVVGGSFDQVLMDVNMPEVNGVEAVRRIRALGHRIAQPRIVMVTAGALMGDREKALAAGVDDFLTKPVHLADLERAIGRRAA